MVFGLGTGFGGVGAFLVRAGGGYTLIAGVLQGILGGPLPPYRVFGRIVLLCITMYYYVLLVLDKDR